MNLNVIFMVVDKEGFGWSEISGKQITPKIFPSLDLADKFIIKVHRKFPEIELFAMPFLPANLFD